VNTYKVHATSKGFLEKWEAVNLLYCTMNTVELKMNLFLWYKSSLSNLAWWNVRGIGLINTYYVYGISEWSSGKFLVKAMESFGGGKVGWFRSLQFPDEELSPTSGCPPLRIPLPLPPAMGRLARAWTSYVHHKNRSAYSSFNQSTSFNQFQPVPTSLNQLQPVSTSSYQFQPVSTSSNQFLPVLTISCESLYH